MAHQLEPRVAQQQPGVPSPPGSRRRQVVAGGPTSQPCPGACVVSSSYALKSAATRAPSMSIRVRGQAVVHVGGGARRRKHLRAYLGPDQARPASAPAQRPERRPHSRALASGFIRYIGLMMSAGTAPRSTNMRPLQRPRGGGIEFERARVGDDSRQQADRRVAANRHAAIEQDRVISSAVAADATSMMLTRPQPTEVRWWSRFRMGTRAKKSAWRSARRRSAPTRQHPAR